MGDIIREDTSLTWSVLLCLLIGLWLTLTRITLGSTASMANANHLIGSLLITISVIALAETARAFRVFNLFFAIALFITPFAYGAGMLATVSSIICGVLLFILTIPRRAIQRSYGKGISLFFKALGSFFETSAPCTIMQLRDRAGHRLPT